MTWARCRAWLLPALEDASEAEVVALLAVGQAQLWPGERSAMVTQLLASDAGRTCHAWLGGGELEELLQLAPGLEAWARQQGCDFATINGRKGWERALRARGYAPHDGMLRKKL